MQNVRAAMRENVILEKSFAFSVRAVRAYQHLASEKKEYVLSKQFLRKKDFISKMYISYKEATETEYWIKLLTETEYFTDAEGSSLLTDCVELKQILTAILKSAKRSV